MADHSSTGAGACGLAHCIGAITVAGILSCLAVVCTPFSHVGLAVHPGFMPAFGALSLLIDSLTAALLMIQARFSRRRSTLRLGTAYFYSALITLPHLLAFPGVFAADSVIGGSASAIWLWCAWHGGFAICVLWFAVGEDDLLEPRDFTRTIAWTVGVVACVTLVATVGLPWLPVLLDDGKYGRLTALGLGPAILAATVLAALVVVARFRFTSVVTLWLSVALLAASLDVALTLLGGGRFSMGWYAARIQSLMSGVCVLFALLSELMREAGRVAAVNSQLEHMVRTDVLTGLCNRRAFELALLAEWRRAQREETPLSLLMVDIDCFKGYNDRYGHPSGDDCLRAVGGVLADTALRPADTAARVGGEEFAIILPVTEEKGALLVAERLRASVAALRVPHGGSGTGYVTVSVGAATVRPYGSLMDVSQVVREADHALYQAKAAGRNATRSALPPPRIAASA